MLYGISPLLGPELLSVLYRMGHGDQIVLADAHFPGESKGQRVVRADGVLIADSDGTPGVGLLDAILTVFALEKEAAPVMMAPIGNDTTPKKQSEYHVE